MKSLTILLMLFLSIQFSNAQSVSGESIKLQFIKDWELAKVLTDEYLDVMPADKYNFKAQDSIRSFAQQMLHLAQVTSAMVSNGTGTPRLFAKGRSLEKSPGAQVKDSVVYYVNASYEFAIQAIKNMDATKLQEKVKDRTMEETRFSWLLKAFAHQMHHRGQTTIYIRLVGLKPPAYLE
jgi:uncharacterized damage-inducible protein DinB